MRIVRGHLRRHPRVGGDVLDVCTGSGAIAISAAPAAARTVTAVDVSRRARGGRARAGRRGPL